MFCPRLVSLILLRKTSLNSTPKCWFNHSFIYNSERQRLPFWVSPALLLYHIHRSISQNTTLCHAPYFYSKHLALLDCTPLFQLYSAALGTVWKTKGGEIHSQGRGQAKSLQPVSSGCGHVGTAIYTPDGCLHGYPSTSNGLSSCVLLSFCPVQPADSNCNP